MMKLQTICLFIALSLSIVCAQKDTKGNHMAFMMRPASRELRLSIDVPLVNIDDTAYEVLRQEALSTTASSSDEVSSMETTTASTTSTTVKTEMPKTHLNKKESNLK